MEHSSEQGAAGVAERGAEHEGRNNKPEGQPKTITIFVNAEARTVTDKADLRRLILAARADGFATTVDQLDYGITALAVPIRAADGRVVAALNSSGYTGMVTPEDMVATRLPDLRAAAARLSAVTARIPALTALLHTA